MFAQYGISKLLKKGSKVLSAECVYEGKKITFKDTLSILNCKLSELPQRFGLECGKKEVFPYKYYTLDRLASNIGIISEAGVYDNWNEEQYAEFTKNIDELNCRTGSDTFDMYKYAEFYCMQDVNILRCGFNKFVNEMRRPPFNIDVFNELTISGIAYHMFRDQVFSKNNNLYELSGHVQHFVRRSVHGGRCMTAFNKKWHTICKLCDFDAVSLYPSAIARLYTVEGKPKVIQPDGLNMEFLKKQTAYAVEIRITKVHKHYAFPLIVYKDENDLNVNRDTKVPVTTVVNDIELEDLINFQQIEFEIIRGYYWDGAKDYRIQDFIKMIFEKRLEYKAQSNPLQELFKLIMNSCYGKTIQKPVKYDLRIIDGEPGDITYDDYYRKHYYSIVETCTIPGANKSVVKLIRQIDRQFSFTLLGSHILAMSKQSVIYIEY